MAQPPQPYPPSAPPAVDGPAPGVRFASPVARFVGYLIDGFVTGAAYLLISLVLGVIVAFAGSNGLDFLVGMGIILYFLAFLVLWLVYFPYFWSRGGQTPGMKVMRIKVVRDEDGGPVSFGSGVVRLLGYFVSSAVLYLGFIWILIDRRKRGWHDLMAGTCVVEA